VALVSVVMKSCKSSQVKAHGYDPVSKKLRVEYTSGGIYEYEGVPQSVYDGLCGCDSVGKYLNGKVKAVGFKFTKAGK